MLHHGGVATCCIMGVCWNLLQHGVKTSSTVLGLPLKYGYK